MKSKKFFNPSSSTVLNIVQNNLCQGCGLCYLLYPNEINFTNKQNFNKPIFNKTEKICPSLQFSKQIIESNSKTNPYFGSYKNLYLVKSTNLHVLKNSSSGGFVTQLIIFLLKNKIINGAIVTTNSDNNPLENEIKIITNHKDLLQNPLESRYSPASPLIKIKDLKSKKGKYVFVGKGCDITALNKLLQIDKEVAQKIFFKIGIFCAHQPSRQATLDLVNKQDISLKSIKNIRFRYGNWPGNYFIQTKNKKIKIPYQIAWSKNLAKEKYKNPRCTLCPDGFNETADFSIGDPWINLKKRKVGSIVISRTQISQNIMNLINQSEDFKVERITPKTIIDSQYSLIQKKKKIPPRLYFLKILKNINISYNNWNLEEIWNKNSTFEKIKFTLIALILYYKHFFKPSNNPRK